MEGELVLGAFASTAMYRNVLPSPVKGLDSDTYHCGTFQYLAKLASGTESPLTESPFGDCWTITPSTTASFHDFSWQHFELRVSNPGSPNMVNSRVTHCKSNSSPRKRIPFEAQTHRAWMKMLLH